MTVNYITEPIPSAMGKGKGGWRGKIVDRSSRSFEEIAAAVAGRTGWSAYQVQSVFTGFMEETIRDARETGNVQQLGDYGSLKLNLRGRFEGIDDVYDPARHALAFSFTPGKRLRTCKPAFALENRVLPKYINIESVCGKDSPDSWRGMLFMIWGHDTLCNGQYVKMSGDDSVTWSCKLADGTEKSGACDKVFNNTPCTLDFHWPEDIPAEAIGRDIVLTFRLHGGEPNRTPVIRRRTVRLYAA